MKPDSNNVVQFTQVNKWYDKLHVLKDINLSINKGEKWVICGPSGSGKSTLIRCINGLEPFQKGKLTVNGLALDSLSEINTIRQQVGMVFQQFNLFPHLSTLQNCTLAPMKVRGLNEAQATEIAMHYLSRVNIAEKAHQYPNQLSGGQQQRVALARALAMEPEIMLFDEPTSALDPEMIKEVLDAMIELADSGITMVCVTHEMGFARQVADHIVFMDQGEIIETAQPSDFFENPRSKRTQQFLDQILTH
ncbi:glutamine ABC transporter ATP-binding protein [Gammaproteobacteria bacterium 45_16_T64]|nr:glutamine ABC transporter ATP-binding protein [Gammaproteobacteria bacterium 45_16_T64]